MAIPWDCFAQARNDGFLAGEASGLTIPCPSLCGVPQRREKGLGNGVKNLSGSADIPKLASLFITPLEMLTPEDLVLDHSADRGE